MWEGPGTPLYTNCAHAAKVLKLSLSDWESKHSLRCTQKPACTSIFDLLKCGSLVNYSALINISTLQKNEHLTREILTD